jgi:hypothetical protein
MLSRTHLPFSREARIFGQEQAPLSFYLQSFKFKSLLSTFSLGGQTNKRYSEQFGPSATRASGDGLTLLVSSQYFVQYPNFAITQSSRLS